MPDLKAPKIVKHETLEGISFIQPPDGISPSPLDNHRLFRVGLKWNLQTGYNPFAPVAFDVYRDEKLLETDFINKEGKIEKISPFTPPRAKEMPQRWTTGTKNIQYNASLPKLPPFSKVSEIKGARYTYVDVTVPFGERIYHVESVDVFGKCTDEKKQIKHDVHPVVPVPAPISIKAELIRKQNPDRFAIVARWDWGRMQRLLAPDLDRFEVFWHMGRHNLEMPGLMVWASETGTPGPSAPSKLNVEFLLQPGPLASIIDMANLGGLDLILRCEGRKYALDNVQVTSTGSNSNFKVTGNIETKQRKNSYSDPRRDGEFKSGTRGILIKKENNSLSRVPVLIEGDQSATGGSTRIVLSSNYQTLISLGDTCLLQVGHAIYPVTVNTIEDFNGHISSVGNIASGAILLSVQMILSWGEKIIPIPGNKCFLEKSNGEAWIDWSKAEDWQAISGLAPTIVNKPTQYPIESDHSADIGDSIPGMIFSSPKPRLMKAHDYATDPIDWEQSSLILPVSNIATASHDIFAGCSIEAPNFQQKIRNNTSRREPEIITEVPQDFSDAEVEALEGQTFNLNKPAFLPALDKVEFFKEKIGNRLITCTFDADPGPNEWRLCCVQGEPYILDETCRLANDNGKLMDRLGETYHFPIRSWVKVNNTEYRFEVENIILKNRIDNDGIIDEVEFEITIKEKESAVHILSPPLRVATFDITDEETWNFYSMIEGGEIVYEADVPEVEVITKAVAVAFEETINRKYLKVAFFPVLTHDEGFKSPINNKAKFYPSFKVEVDTLSEEEIRKAEPIYLSVRSVALEGAKTFVGSMAPAVLTTGEKGMLKLSRPSVIEAPTVPTIYARPSSGRSFYTLQWSAPSGSGNYEYRVYRISAEILDKRRNKDSSGEYTEERLDVFNNLSRVEDAIQLRNKSILTETSFTDVIEGGGAGEYYYKIRTVDPTGTESEWEPSPTTIRPIHVLNTIPPDKPTLLKALPGDKKVTLEWLKDPRADAYWIYRMANREYDPGGPTKVQVSDLDPVPITIGNENIPIRFKGDTSPTMDLFFAPDMYHLIGLYLKKDYEEWLNDNKQNITNHLKGTTGTEVTIIGRNGVIIGNDGTGASTSNPKPKLPKDIVWIDSDPKQKVGPDMAIEYLVEEKEVLQGYWQVIGGSIAIKRSLSIAQLVGLYQLEGFDPVNPQNPLQGTLDLSGPYPVIRDVLYQNGDPVEDGYRPVIIYKETTDATAPDQILYGTYPVKDGEIALILGPILPVIKYDSENGSADDPVPLFDYLQSRKCIVGVYKKSEYDADPSTAANHYTGGATFDGINITGINLPDNTEVVIIVHVLRVSYRTVLDYRSLRIEGYPQARSIESVKVLNGNEVADVKGFQFDPANPDTLLLPTGTIPSDVDPEALPSVVINYLDDTGMSRTIKVETSSDTVSPSSVSPYIKEIIGVWRKDEYDESNPDMSKELVVSKGTDCCRWNPGTTLINIHSKADLPTKENWEPVRVVIRFKDHQDEIHSVDHVPWRVKYIDDNPHLNTEMIYQIRAIRTLNYEGNDVQIKSEYSNPKQVTVRME